MPLSVLHQVIQVLFDWYDGHLHRFALGGDPFDLHSQLFLCDYDVTEGDETDATSLPDSDVRLDETLREAGDILRYVYDHGDSWHLTIRLEAVLPLPEDGEPAVVVGGRRAPPPEDSGGSARPTSSRRSWTTPPTSTPSP